MKKGNSILDFMQAFPDEDSCIMYLERILGGEIRPFLPLTRDQRSTNAEDTSTDAGILESISMCRQGHSLKARNC